MLVVAYLRIFCQTHNHEDSLWFFPKCFIVVFLTFRLLIHFLIFCKVSIQLDAFACGYPTIPAPFVEKTTLSPLSLHALKYRLTIVVWVYIWTFSSIPLICIFILCQYQCLDYCCFVVSFFLFLVVSFEILLFCSSLKDKNDLFWGPCNSI